MGIRAYPDTPRVYLDMDGVLADFESGARKNNLPPKEFKRVAGAYLNLEPMPGAHEAVFSLLVANFQVFVLTKIPALNPHAATEKLLWAQKHFPALGENVIITPDKGAVGTSRDFLVDDHPEWANAKSFPGTVILFNGLWAPVLREIIQGM